MKKMNINPKWPFWLLMILATLMMGLGLYYCILVIVLTFGDG